MSVPKIPSEYVQNANAKEREVMEKAAKEIRDKMLNENVNTGELIDKLKKVKDEIRANEAKFPARTASVLNIGLKAQEYELTKKIDVDVAVKEELEKRRKRNDEIRKDMELYEQKKKELETFSSSIGIPCKVIKKFELREYIEAKLKADQFEAYKEKKEKEITNITLKFEERLQEQKREKSRNPDNRNKIKNIPEPLPLLQIDTEKDELRNENDKLKNENNNLKKEKHSLQQENEALKNENQELKNKIEILSLENITIKAEAEQKKKDKDDNDRKEKEAQTKIKNITLSLDESFKELVQYEQRQLNILNQTQAIIKQFEKEQHIYKQKIDFERQLNQMTMQSLQELGENMEAEIKRQTKSLREYELKLENKYALADFQADLLEVRLAAEKKLLQEKINLEIEENKISFKRINEKLNDIVDNHLIIFYQKMDTRIEKFLAEKVSEIERKWENVVKSRQTIIDEQIEKLVQRNNDLNRKKPKSPVLPTVVKEVEQKKVATELKANKTYLENLCKEYNIPVESMIINKIGQVKHIPEYQFDFWEKLKCYNLTRYCQSQLNLLK